MFKIQLKILTVSDVETITKKDNSGTLQVRWLVGIVNDKKIAFKVWNDLTNHPKLIVDEVIEIEFRAESREYNGKYLTDLTLTKIN